MLEIEDIGTLAVMLHAIGANGGMPVTVGEHGALANDLPRAEISRVAHLGVNGLFTTSRDGSSWVVGYGPRVREIAAAWAIDVR